MSQSLDPAPLFGLMSKQLPDELRPHLLVVGSLAAAYHFRGALGGRGVNTKDADFVIQPVGALLECQAIATRLLEAGWKRHEQCWPGLAAEPADELRAIRLHPPGIDFYFVELLGLPAAGQQETQRWLPIELADGWYGLPAFRYMGLTLHHVQQAAEGLSYAAPSMMALANLLSHDVVGHATMREQIGGRTLRRAAKDLGRVLGLALLTPDLDELEAWTGRWGGALRAEFPDEASALAARVGNGLRELLDDEDALDEARHALDVGLLAGRGLTTRQLQAVGKQVLTLVAEPLRDEFR